MIIKLGGSLLIVFGAYCVGCQIGNRRKKISEMLKQLIIAIDQIGCELRYRKTSLPLVFRRIQTENATLNRFFTCLSDELDGQISPDVRCCVHAALTQISGIPEEIIKYINLMGDLMGRFDLKAQVEGLDSLQEECRALLLQLSDNQDVYFRNCRTLALCAGTTLVILLF